MFRTFRNHVENFTKRFYVKNIIRHIFKTNFKAIRRDAEKGMYVRTPSNFMTNIMACKSLVLMYDNKSGKYSYSFILHLNDIRDRVTI